MRVWGKLAKLSWRPFEEAREFARSLCLKSGIEWIKYCRGKLPHYAKKPEDIPTKPEKVYKDQWIRMQDWLGAGSRRGGWKSFEEAREFARSLD